MLLDYSHWFCLVTPWSLLIDRDYELSFQAIIAPFDVEPFKLHISQCSRTIMDPMFPKELSVNDGVPKSKCMGKYSNIQTLNSLGPPANIFKADVS